MYPPAVSQSGSGQSRGKSARALRVEVDSLLHYGSGNFSKPRRPPMTVERSPAAFCRYS